MKYIDQEDPEKELHHDDLLFSMEYYKIIMNAMGKFRI